MTTPLNDDLAEMEALLEKVTKGPWKEVCGIAKCYVGSLDDEFGFSVQHMHPGDGHETNAHNDCQFVARSREFIPKLIAAYREMEGKLDEATRVFKAVLALLEEDRPLTAIEVIDVAIKAAASLPVVPR